MYAFVRFAMLGSLILAAVGWWMKDSLPPPDKLSPDVHEEPRQKSVRKPPIRTSVKGIDYSIQPRFSYDISALVVSLHHSDTWWDYIHKQFSDNINLMDLCVVWGGNAQSGAYKRISFSNNQFECHWGASSQEAWSAFNQAEASNNHMVTDDPEVAKTLRSIRIGDQVRVQGYLVDYTVIKDGKALGTRVSSDNRIDTGPGACEVLYVESINLTPSSAGRSWRIVQYAALIALLLSVIAWVSLPIRGDD